MANHKDAAVARVPARLLLEALTVALEHGLQIVPNITGEGFRYYDVSAAGEVYYQVVFSPETAKWELIYVGDED
jgi:hypothetical protein